MLPYRDSWITRAILALFFVLVIAYAYFEARGIVYGPSIEVPTETIESREAFVSIKGVAERISKLSMNGLPISVTEEGAFNEPYLLSPGLNRIILDATDSYGRMRQEIIQIVYTPDETAIPIRPAPTAASSTPANDPEDSDPSPTLPEGSVPEPTTDTAASSTPSSE